MGKEFSLEACCSCINSGEKFHEYKVNVHASTNIKCTKLEVIFYQILSTSAKCTNLDFCIWSVEDVNVET